MLIEYAIRLLEKIKKQKEIDKNRNSNNTLNQYSREGVTFL